MQQQMQNWSGRKIAKDETNIAITGYLYKYFVLNKLLGRYIPNGSTGSINIMTLFS